MFEEERLETGPCPASVSSNSGPVVIFCSLSTYIHHVVDGTGAAEYFTAGKCMDKAIRARLFVRQRFLTPPLRLNSGEVVLPAVQF